MEGVGGRMEDEEDPTDEADDGGLTGVLLLRREQKADKPGTGNQSLNENQAWKIHYDITDLLLML